MAPETYIQQHFYQFIQSHSSARVFEIGCVHVKNTKLFELVKTSQVYLHSDP